ncbi:MAG: SixA phosphatase family protein [Deltaproteobacteria bacterium]|jgi:phosphohistidine phosphatase SixA
MKFLLMRHGDAVRGDVPDQARHLSRTGRHEVLAVARALTRKLQGVRIGHVVSSHLVRAVQTAEIVTHELARAGVEVDPMVHADPRFEPDGSPRPAAERLAHLASDHAPATILCVCHEPIVRGLAAQLAPRSASVPFATGGLVAIDHGAILWSLDPRTLD